jgi:hypothetical protein
MPEHHIEKVLQHLADNPGATLPSVLHAAYGRTRVHVDELLSIFHSSRTLGYGAASTGLWYLIADNEELKDANHNRDSPGPVIDAAISALWNLRNTLGATHLDFTPSEGEPTP